GETEAEIPITANPNARAGDWKIIVRGEANARGQLVAATPFATLKVVPPYLAMTLPATTMEQGTSTSMKVAVEQLVPFVGEARVELKGLPPGVTTEPVAITSESAEFDFQIVAAADARPGQH